MIMIFLSRLAMQIYKNISEPANFTVDLCRFIDKYEKSEKIFSSALNLLMFTASLRI
jgi:hypothetical protein